MRSSSRVLYEVQDAILLFYRELIPRIEDRKGFTWKTLPQAFLYLVPFFFMAYLVRRRETHLMRLLLLPTVLATTVWCTFGYKSLDPRMAWYEWVRGLFALVVIAKSLDYAFAKEGRRRLGESGPLPPIYEPEPDPASRSRPTGEHPASDTATATRLPRPLLDALDVSCALRGIGWDFGKGVWVPRPPSALPAERSAFITSTVRRIVRNQLYVDVFDTIGKLTPGVTATGGTIFLPQLPPLQRYVLSTCLHLGHGLLIIAGVELVYDYLSLAGVVLLGQSPAAWPPIHGHLRHARSLHQFWSRGWHQALRYTLLTLGGFPGRWLAGGPGMVFGTFLASGLFHEIGITVAGRDVDHRVTVFFLLQAFGITLEKAFRKVTGRRVGGVLGTVWAMIFVLGFGQMCTDAWFARGIGGAWSIPPFISVVRPLLQPILRRVGITP